MASIAVLGGDNRQISLIKHIVKENIGVRVFGLPDVKSEGVVSFPTFEEAIDGANAIVLPLPASPDGKHLHAPLWKDDELPLLSEIFEKAKEKPILGGRFTPMLKQRSSECGIRLIDYFESEELQQKNALPTAEGAVSILMREIPRVIKGLQVGITGYGRIGSVLSDLLLAMGAEVTVAARKREALLRAMARGCRVCRLDGTDAMLDFVRQGRVFFNTVPHWLFDARVLQEMQRDSLIIDLASAPGGVDAASAAALGIRVIFALSLPGKYAPETAGEILAETVLSLLREEGVL